MTYQSNRAYKTTLSAALLVAALSSSCSKSTNTQPEEPVQRTESVDLANIIKNTARKPRHEVSMNPNRDNYGVDVYSKRVTTADGFLDVAFLDFPPYGNVGKEDRLNVSFSSLSRNGEGSIDFADQGLNGFESRLEFDEFARLKRNRQIDFYYDGREGFVPAANRKIPQEQIHAVNRSYRELVDDARYILRTGDQNHMKLLAWKVIHR